MPDRQPNTDIRLVPTTGSPEFAGFAVHIADVRVGTVALNLQRGASASIRWNVGAEYTHRLPETLKLATDLAFAELGITRVEALVDAADPAAITLTARAGMRKEGVVRGNGTDPDRLLVSRLASDPDPWSRNGFLGILNAGLPTKRVIGQGIVCDESGRVLLCELTYKREWDLPGGVIEVGESPAHGVVREIKEELDFDFTVRGLITVNWLPAWRGWDDACIFVFDLGAVTSDVIDSMTLEKSEIKALHWCDADEVAERATSVTHELLEWLRSPGPRPPYRESSQEKS